MGPVTAHSQRATTTERETYLWLRSHYGGPGVHLQRIETMAGAGVPDVNACAYGREAWLELKIFRWIRRSDGLALQLTLRKAQWAWMLTRQRAGGRAWIVAAVPHRHPYTGLRTPPNHRRYRLRVFHPRELQRFIILDGTHQPRVEFTAEDAENLDVWPLLESLLTNSGPPPA